MQLWERRSEPDIPPEVRRAVNHAVDAIDDLLLTLYHQRASLLRQARVYDDTTAARTDELLARYQGGGDTS